MANLLQGAVFQGNLYQQRISQTAESGPDGKARLHDSIPNQEVPGGGITAPLFLPSTKVETVVIT